MQQDSQFEISKFYDTGLQRYRNYKIRVCCKDSIPLEALCNIAEIMHFQKSFTLIQKLKTFFYKFNFFFKP